jgi:hypothetical protein
VGTEIGCIASMSLGNYSELWWFRP